MITAVKRFFSYDRSLNTVNSPAGRVTLIGLVIPLLLESVARSLVGTVNTVILSHHSATAAAAVGAANQVVMLLSIFYSMISTGVSIVISQNLGAGNLRTAKKAASMAMVLCSLISVVLGLLMSAFSIQIMTMMNLEAGLVTEAADYFRIVCGLNVVQTAITVCAAICRSYGRTKINLYVMLVMNLINALMSYLVVFRPFEIPLYGIKGVACSAIISQTIALIINLVLMSRSGIKFNFRELLPLDMPLLKSTLKVGLPGGVGSVSYSVSQTVTTAIMATLGAQVLSCKVYVSSFLFYSYVISFAIGQATSIMIGYLVGEGNFDRAYRLNLQNLKLSMCTSFLFSLSLIFFAGSIMTLFTDDPQIIALAKQVVIVDLFVELGRSINHVEEFSLRGAGDVFFQMIVAASSCWVISVFFCWLLGVQLGLGLIGCWIAFALDEITRGVLYLLRWRTRKWEKKRIVSGKTEA